MIEKKYFGNENDNLPILSAGLEMQWRAKKRVSKLTKLPTMFGKRKKKKKRVMKLRFGLRKCLFYARTRVSIFKKRPRKKSWH